MRVLSTIVGTAALMSAGAQASGKGEYGHDSKYGLRKHDHDDDDDVILKIRGKFRAEAKIELEKFMDKVREKHGDRFSKTCAEACFKTRSCRNDPQAQWSYCKYDHKPSTCFGLYRVLYKGHGDDERSEWGWGEGKKFGRLCYQPNDPRCPERFPLLCDNKYHDEHKEKRKEKDDKYDDSDDDMYDFEDSY